MCELTTDLGKPTATNMVNVRTTLNSCVLSCALLILTACSTPGDQRDAEASDSDVSDGSVSDSGTLDSGASDADTIADAESTDADTSPDGSDADATCTTNPTPLLIRDYGGTAGSERYFVEVVHDNEPRALQLDTGSSLTFLHTGAGQPDYEPDIATIHIGCEEISVDGRGFDGNDDPIEGLPVVGVLGMDYLLESPALLDVEERLLTRYERFPEELTTTTCAFSVAFDDVHGHALFPVIIDGSAIRLMFDTGGGDTLWVGVEGNPGDPVQYAEDVEGNIFPYYVGTGVLELEGQPDRIIPVDRAPEFPYFDLVVEALGGNLQGLLGVTAFPAEELLFDGTSSQMWVLPK